MLAWWSNVDPAALEHLPVSDMRCLQWPRPRQDLRQSGLLADMDGDQDRGGRSPGRSANDLDQRLDAASRSTDGEHRSMISFSLDPTNGHWLYRCRCGQVCIAVVSTLEELSTNTSRR